jgi:hypothetical protein
MKSEYTPLSARTYRGLKGSDGIVSLAPLAFIRKDKLYVVEMFEGEARMNFPSPEWTRLDEPLDPPSGI